MGVPVPWTVTIRSGLKGEFGVKFDSPLTIEFLPGTDAGESKNRTT
jgi:hypothetical protein